MLEAELRTESLQDVLTTVEVMVRSLVTNLSNSKLFDQLLSFRDKGECGEDENSAPNPDAIRGRWDGLMKQPWPQITYEEALCRLRDAASSDQVIFQHKPSWSTGLQVEHEKFIAAEIGHGSPVFVTHYPREIKPFYMLPSNTCHTEVSSMRETAACFDLLFPEIGEVVGGSLREHRLHDLIQSMHKCGVMKSTRNQRAQDSEQLSNSSSTEAGSLDWYIDLRRYGSVPHGGFGLGFDRLLGYLAGLRNIKDVVSWPRYYGRCDC